MDYKRSRLLRRFTFLVFFVSFFLSAALLGFGFVVVGTLIAIISLFALITIVYNGRKKSDRIVSEPFRENQMNIPAQSYGNYRTL